MTHDERKHHDDRQQHGDAQHLGEHRRVARLGRDAVARADDLRDVVDRAAEEHPGRVRVEARASRRARGYRIMAIVESAVTPATVKTSSRSESRRAAAPMAIAIAAEAPQIAVAPPVSTPKRRDCPKTRAATMPKAMVATTAPTMTSPCSSRAPPSWSTVMRAPSRATPKRSTRRAAKSTPAFALPSMATG